MQCKNCNKELTKENSEVLTFTIKRREEIVVQADVRLCKDCCEEGINDFKEIME